MLRIYDCDFEIKADNGKWVSVLRLRKEVMREKHERIENVDTLSYDLLKEYVTDGEIEGKVRKTLLTKKEKGLEITPSYCFETIYFFVPFGQSVETRCVYEEVIPTMEQAYKWLTVSDFIQYCKERGVENFTIGVDK